MRTEYSRSIPTQNQSDGVMEPNEIFSCGKSMERK